LKGSAVRPYLISFVRYFRRTWGKRIFFIKVNRLRPALELPVPWNINRLPIRNIKIRLVKRLWSLIWIIRKIKDSQAKNNLENLVRFTTTTV